MATDDFFRARLDSMIDMRHPLAVLATRMPWAEIEASLAPALAHKDRSGRVVQDADLFGPTTQIAGAGLSNAGRPRLPLRLMVALLYLKHAFNLSDEELCERWSENVVWQFFSGMAYYEPRPPCDATQIGRFRRVLGEAGVEQLLKSTIEASVSMGAVKRSEFEMDAQQRRWLKRRQAIEPAIGHAKSDHRMDRCWLGGSTGDALHAVLCAAGFNIRWLLRAIAAKGLVALLLAFSQMALYAARTANVLRIPTLTTGRTDRRFAWQRQWVRPSLATG